MTHKLEALIDKFGPYNVLCMFAEICDGKSEHVATAWQDDPLASLWSNLGAKVDDVALHYAKRIP